MELKGALLALCLFCITHQATAVPQISLSIPTLLKSGGTQKACLTVQRHIEAVDVQITLIANTNYTIVDEQIPPGDVFKTYDLQVPKVKESTPVFLQVSAVSGNYSYKARRSLVIAPTANVTFIETDKYMYKGGQIVKVYVMSLDNNLRPVEEKFTEIYVTDQAGNRLYQWLNQITNGVFLSLTFAVPDDPELGIYQIVATTLSGTSVNKAFKVDEYMLPKFSVTMKVPSAITILDKNVSVEVTGRYTYDKGVPGKITGRMCRPPAYYYMGNACNRNPDGICLTFTGETDSEGTYKGTVDLSSFQLDRSALMMSLVLQITLTEQGTNFQMTETQTISITSMLGRAYFDYNVMRSYFKRGLSLLVPIIIENGLGQPDSNQKVEVKADGKSVANLTSDENGRAEYEVDTSDFTTSGVNIELVYKTQEQCYDGNWVVPSYSNDNRYVSRFYSRTGSVLQLQGPRGELECGTTYNIRVQYAIAKEALAEGETVIKFIYMVIARAEIKESGEHSVDVSESLKGEFILTYKTSPDHVPVMHYTVQFMLKDEVVGDSINLNLENCFNNQVSSNFSLEIGTPGSSVDLDVTATPESVCLTRISDASLLLLNKGQTLSPAMVYSSLQYSRLYGFYVAGLNLQPPSPPCTDANQQKLIDGIYWQPMVFSQESDLSKVYGDIGLHLITGTSFQQPQLCSAPPSRPIFTFGRPNAEFARPNAEFANFAMAADGPAGTATTTTAVSVGAPALTTFRDYFPEMWYSAVLRLGESGSTLVPLTVPGTITKWKSNVVCLSNETGFGMNKYPANLTSFQKLFVDTSLPNVIMRGEIMYLVASVANYMDKSAKVRISLQSSSDYVAEPVDEDPEKCVNPRQRVSYSWKINATKIGESTVTVTAETIKIGDSCEGPADPNEPNYKDTIVQSFTVLPEGIKQDVTKTDLICVTGDNAYRTVETNPSGSIVPGSMSARFQVSGVMLGAAAVHFKDLIRQPMGCGEQNLATMLPIVYAMNFLELIGSLTEETKQRALEYLATGYVRQVAFRHPDGSFSAFGPGRSQPSAWLTLLTMKAFWSISPYTFVDKNMMKQGMLYLGSLQDLDTGAFRVVGTLFNNGLKGGADGTVAFTCAMVAFLSQTVYASSPALLQPALAYLDAASQKELPVYDLAALFCVYRTIGNVAGANTIRQKLMSLAIDDGRTLHWERPYRPEQKTPFLFLQPASSGELELTALVLKGMAHGENSTTVSAEDLNIMAKICAWLVQYQNIYGFYVTTSDSVAVLEALSLYGALVYQKDASNTVQLKYGDELIKEFTVDQSNRILLQSVNLPPVPGNYSMVVSGTGCVLLQTGVAFSVPVRQENSAFSLSVTTFPDDCKDGVAYKVNMLVNSSYHGIQNKSNMAVIDIPLFPGYSLESQSLSALRSKCPKVEVKNNHVIIYLNEVTSEGISLNISQEMGPIVTNIQQRTCSISDYYERDENGVCVIDHPCARSV